jgi:large subunit ribosomal protein L9
MRVVLRNDLSNLGKRGDICDVSDGYARNFLLPKGHAIVATEGVNQQATAMRRARDLRDARDREAAETVARTLVPAVIRIKARAGSGDNVNLDRRRLHLDEPIKTLGTHEIPVKLHSEVEFRVTVEVSKS